MPKTTQKHFQIFKEECEKWIEIFGLKNWEVHFSHKLIPSDAMALCTEKAFEKVCTLSLGKNWNDCSLNELELRKSAFHEVCHVLFARVGLIADTRYVMCDDVTEEVHSLIRILENVLWKGT